MIDFENALSQLPQPFRGPKMIRFKTASGSWYTVDTEKKWWYRAYNPLSTNVRTEHGAYNSVSAISIGKGVIFSCPPLNPNFRGRELLTTRVVFIEHFTLEG